MADFIPGQRWISDTELQMGLGTVMSADFRTVTLLFLATGERRVYAKQTAPLTRVRFAPGDSVQSHEGWALTVADVQERNGLLTYVGTRKDGAPAQLEEGQLDNFIQLSRPTDRLFTGQIDQDKWFELRYQTHQHTNRLAHSDLYGLTGSRTSLIPHQLYIAHEVANRYAPRVLLADEVGLGKTIEGGLILHHQLLTERAQRVLIVVPESLQTQWLVEMLRRFNRRFSIFDEERCEAIEESNDQENPFLSEQLILCSLDFLVRNPERFEQACASEWDLLVVDEAHHLQWSPEQASVEYTLVEKLAAQTKGVLLLTATPEQLGKAGHFARLRLLDPDRFADFATFIEEEKAYQPVAEAVQSLFDEQPLHDDARRALRGALGESDNERLFHVLHDDTSDEIEKAAARNALIDNLLDRHGTGRVLFRNTRASVKGFPERRVSGYPLPLPQAYADMFASAEISEPQLLLCPELLYRKSSASKQAPWTQFDPRIAWLCDKLKSLRPHKVLVIAANARTALELAQALKTATGIHAAVFHEGMSIIERDRAGAYFADKENGSPVLICSEIGSEGRNFQFAHHLVLFDLPFNPDLLEQRIGRLDRIGQTEVIHIHVPYLQNSAQETMFQWYHLGLSAFEHTCPAGHSVFTQVQHDLSAALRRMADAIELQTLVEKTRHIHQELNEALQRGRDRLLEHNSCRLGIANDLKARAMEQDAEREIESYMESVFDCFGIDLDFFKGASFIIRPGTGMEEPFPELSDDGATFCYGRDVALTNEDLQFITWEHPMTIGAMDKVLSSERGNTAVTALRYSGVRPGTLLLECLYILDTASTEKLQSRRFLPPTTIRIVVDEHGKSHEAKLGHETINRTRAQVDGETAAQIVRVKVQEIRKIAAAGEKLAHEQAPGFLQSAHARANEMLEKEISRLKALRSVNPNVRGDEISFFENQQRILANKIETASLRLDALRVIVATG